MTVWFVVDLVGRVVVFTGALSTMHRVEACLLVEAAGGIAEPGLTRRTDVLVLGGLYRPSRSVTRKLVRAADLGVLVVSEEEFLRALPSHLAPPVDGVLFDAS